MGNSEACHNALRAGRIFAQGVKLVGYALASGRGFKYVKGCFENGTLHLVGLLSDGGVHSRLDQAENVEMADSWARYQQKMRSRF